jgi:polar amino acid transport system substrate-binding protein
MRKTLYRTFASVFGFSLLGVHWTVPLYSVAADLETIARRGRLVVAVKENTPPLGFRDAQGRLQGFEIEVAQRLAQELLGRTDAIELKPVLNRDRLSVLTEGQADVTIARVTLTSGRTRIVSFSQPYYTDGTGIVTRSPQIQQESDLANQSIAVLKNSSTIAVLRYRIPQAKLVGVASYQEAQQVLVSGQAVAFAADVSVLSGWDTQVYRRLPLRLSAEPLAVAIPKGLQYDELRRRVDQAIAKMRREGWLQQRAAHWGLPWDTLK